MVIKKNNLHDNKRLIISHSLESGLVTSLSISITRLFKLDTVLQISYPFFFQKKKKKKKKKIKKKKRLRYCYRLRLSVGPSVLCIQFTNCSDIENVIKKLIRFLECSWNHE